MRFAIVLITVLVMFACQSVTSEQRSMPMTKAIQANGTTLTYEEQGTGTPVVFLHGGFADHRIWEAQRKAVASRYRFIAPTLRYFGTAPWPDNGERFSQETHVADTAAFIRELKVGPVYLVGRSYGAYTAAIVALRYPELVSGLVLNEPPAASLLTTDAEKAVLAADVKEMLPLQAAAKAGSINEATRLFADWTNANPGGFDALPADVQRMHLDNARTVPLQLTARSIPVSCEQLAQLRIPVSITKGEFGRAYFKLIADAMHRCIPGAELTVIKGARHGAPTEQPEAFNELLLAFLPRP